MAKPYVHRLKQKNAAGLKLLTYPEPRQSPLADHKTMNYLYYLYAGRWAAEKGADEAVVLNPDGSVSETNTANILLVNKKSVIIPESAHVLRGIFQSAALELLASWGYVCEYQKIYPKDLVDSDQLILTNSLMGAVPVIAVDGKPTYCAKEFCEKINRILL
jgi:para-aminobenzoate synthetase component 1